MKYLLAIAVFLAGTLLPLALRGQSVILTSGPAASGAWVQPAPFLGGPAGFRDFDGFRPVAFPPFFGYPSSYPFTYFYPSLWPPLDVQYEQASRIAHGDVEGEVAAQQKEYLSSQVKALADEVQSLRQQQASPNYAPESIEPSRNEGPQQFGRAPHPSVRQEFPATVFVFRDGHEMEVRDYAVFGDTLWVFSEQAARKFPMSDFDIAASRQVNEEHGVEFPVSRPRQQ
ncbi:MAG TPA: hypothetical protein VJW77_05475 [Terriglobia bacterium]|nr:hypothetical protein [Terriglobia bacterium]